MDRGANVLGGAPVVGCLTARSTSGRDPLDDDKASTTVGVGTPELIRSKHGPRLHQAFAITAQLRDASADLRELSPGSGVESSYERCRP